MGDNTIPTNLPPTIPVGSPTPEEVEELVSTDVANIDLSKILGDKSIEDIREIYGDEITEIPIIDLPDFKLTVKIDPVRLTAILNIESTAEQAKHIQDVIKADQGNIKARNDQRLKKIGDTLKKMDDAAKASLFNKIFGWFMVAVAVITSIVLSVASGGLALGPVVGALLAVTFQALNEAKVTDKIVKAIAEDLKKNFGMDKETAQIVATVLWTVTQIALSILGGMAGGAAAEGLENIGKLALTSGMDGIKALGKNAPKVFLAIGIVSGLAAIGATTWSTITNYLLGLSQSDTTKYEALIKMLQDRMEENEDMLDTLMRLLNEAPEELLELISAALDAEHLISENMGEGVV